jgi:hypothetical protein
VPSVYGPGQAIDIEEKIGGDVSSKVHTALSKNEWHLDLVHDLPFQSRQGDPGIDDPVNDTGLGSQCADLQVSGVLLQSGESVEHKKD